jgi:hypothetical protein
VKELDLPTTLGVIILSRTEFKREKVKSFSLELGKYEAMRGDRLLIDLEADCEILSGLPTDGCSRPVISTAYLNFLCTLNRFITLSSPLAPDTYFTSFNSGYCVTILSSSYLRFMRLKVSVRNIRLSSESITGYISSSKFYRSTCDIK